MKTNRIMDEIRSSISPEMKLQMYAQGVCPPVLLILYQVRILIDIVSCNYSKSVQYGNKRARR